VVVRSNDADAAASARSIVMLGVVFMIVSPSSLFSGVFRPGASFTPDNS
jgi:hypothetical protein